MEPETNRSRQKNLLVKNRLALQHWALAHGYIRIVDVLLDVVDDEGVVGTVEDARVLLGRLQEGVVLATAPTQVGPGTSVLPAQKKKNLLWWFSFFTQNVLKKTIFILTALHACYH